VHLPTYVGASIKVVDIVRKAVFLEKERSSCGAYTVRSCQRLTPVDDAGNIALFVNEDVLRIEVGMLNGKCLWLSGVKHRLTKKDAKEFEDTTVH
jgi:hypothetical protein